MPAVMIRELDIESLKKQFDSAKPFRHVVLENFLEPEFAREVAASYPPYQQSVALGDQFQAVNEKLKVQITDGTKFPAPVKRLAEALASKAFTDTLAEMSGIKDLLWDDGFAGGGMHQTARSGRLDVHVDFNWLQEKNLYRRLNLLLYLNPEWDSAWGGDVELWDQDVKVRHQSVSPKLNRCLIFETSEISYHGVTPVHCPPGVSRQSFAVYYYTKNPPAHAAASHSTIFRARPDERIRKHILMPAERLQRRALGAVRSARQRVKRFIGRHTIA
jgi:hypothetical protein